MRVFILLFLALYFAPSIAEFLRRSKAPTPLAGYKVFASVFLVNFLLGWSILGWLVAWWLAYSEVFAARMAVVPAPSGGGSYYRSQTPASSSGWEPSQRQERPCGSCGGTGSQTCTACGGRGSWYEMAQRADAVAQLVNCNYCTSSGKIQCQSCGGSGRAAF
jgi:hypothetical protein